MEINKPKIRVLTNVRFWREADIVRGVTVGIPWRPLGAQANSRDSPRAFLDPLNAIQDSTRAGFRQLRRFWAASPPGHRGPWRGSGRQVLLRNLLGERRALGRHD